MKKLHLLATIALVGLGLGAAAPMALAQTPRIVQTHCDTLSLNPPLVRITFAVINLGPTPVCSIHLSPIQSGPTPADSCRILECSVPVGWECALDGTGGAIWSTLPGVPCIGEGQKVENFDIILDPLFCCYRAQFDEVARPNFTEDVVCFECEKPTPNRASTWGDLKARYR